MGALYIRRTVPMDGLYTRRTVPMDGLYTRRTVPMGSCWTVSRLEEHTREPKLPHINGNVGIQEGITGAAPCLWGRAGGYSG